MMLYAKDIIVLLPLLILGLTFLFVILNILCSHNQFITVLLTVLGFSFSFFSLFFIWHFVGERYFFSLIYVDKLSILYISLVLFGSLMTIMSAHDWLIRNSYNNCDEFYLLIIISSIGAILLLVADHLVTLFLGLELVSLPLFGLIGYNYERNYVLEATIKYAVLSSISSLFFLFGVSFFYVSTGNLSFIDIAVYLKDIDLFQLLVIIALLMMMVSFCFKLSLFPFHLWTPDVYQGAPAYSIVFLSTVSKISVFVVMMRFFLLLPNLYKDVLMFILFFISVCSIFFGNLLAMRQYNIKRLLGYSSIAHFGYLLLTIMSMNNSSVELFSLSLETIGIYLIGYFLANVGAFGAISLINYDITKEDNSCCKGVMDIFSSKCKGLFWKEPILAFSFTIILLSMAGIPMTLGFVCKFYLISLGVISNFWFLTLCIIVGSIIAVFYYLRIIINFYSNPTCSIINNNDHHPFVEWRLPNNWIFTMAGSVVIVSALLLLILGFYPQLLIFFIHFFL